MATQAILTTYFNATKSRECTNPAKKRKVVVENGEMRSKSSITEDRASTFREDKPASKKFEASYAASSASVETSKLVRRRKSRNINRTKKPNGTTLVHKPVLDSVVSKTTSAQDDHKACASRKTRVNKSDATDVSSESSLESSTLTTATSKSEPKLHSSDMKRPNEKTADSKCNERSANISSYPRNGLKINPWIAEQAKLVLASRGKQALEKSLQQKKTAKSVRTTLNGKIGEKEMSKPEKSHEVTGKVDVPRLSKVTANKSKCSLSLDSKSDSKLPAYQRFSHLLEAKKPKQPVGVTLSLPLPYHFKVLEEMFRCVDVVLSLKQKRYETCTFEKLKDSVQEMCRKKFEKKHLAQMRAVYPSAFVFRQQKNSSNSSAFQLTIEFNLDEFRKGHKSNDFKFIESSILIARQKHFKNELQKLAFAYHRDYLAKNYPSLKVDDAAIKRWHPSFPLDEVPEVSESPLPEPPQVKTFSTAQDVLDQARQNLAPRAEKALNYVAKKSTESSPDVNTMKESTSNNVKNKTRSRNPSLKGISQSLIDKIRLKEEKKLQESLTVDSEVVEKQVMMQRLPDLCRILKTYFVSERKAAISLEDVNNKLAESYKSTLSLVQVEKHVELLSEVAPEWLSVIHVRKCPYVKLKKDMNVNRLIEKIKGDGS